MNQLAPECVGTVVDSKCMVMCVGLSGSARARTRRWHGMCGSWRDGRVTRSRRRRRTVASAIRTGTVVVRCVATSSGIVGSRITPDSRRLSPASLRASVTTETKALKLYSTLRPPTRPSSGPSSDRASGTDRSGRSVYSVHARHWPPRSDFRQWTATEIRATGVDLCTAADLGPPRHVHDS